MKTKKETRKQQQARIDRDLLLSEIARAANSHLYSESGNYD